MDDLDLSKPLEPHTYPVLFKYVLGVSLISLGIFFSELPYFFMISDIFKKADTMFQLCDYQSARNHYEKLLKMFPHNHRLKVRVACAFFRSPDQEDHLIALGYLHKFKLRDSEWQELCCHMPAQYRDLFETKEEKA